MLPDAHYFIILLCLTPDDFTRQRKSAATQWVKLIYIGRVCMYIDQAPKQGITLLMYNVLMKNTKK